MSALSVFAAASLVATLLNLQLARVFAGEDHLSGFPSLKDITGSAIYLYDNMEGLLDSYVFYPDLKFTCSGRIRRITFLGERRLPERNVERYLRFVTWSTRSEHADFFLNRTRVKSLDFDVSSSSVLVNLTGNVSLYQIELGDEEEFIFEKGDVFGMRQSDSTRSKVALLQQIGGGHSYSAELDSSNFHTLHFMISRLTKTSYVPLLAIDAGQNASCLEGFLKEDILEMIANATFLQPPESAVATLNNTESVLRLFVNMTVATSGALTKWTFAAKFNPEGEDGEWPELQIWRRFGESGFHYKKIAGTRMKPEPTGYLNVYEYDLTASEQPVEVLAGDVLGVYQPDTQQSQYTVEFILSENTSAPTNYIIRDPDMDELDIVDAQYGFEVMALVPMVFAQIEVAPPTTTVSTTATPPPHTTTTTPSLTKLTPKQEDSNTNTLLVIIVATGVAVGILVILVIVAVAILMMVTARRMKLVKRVDLLGHHSPMENPSYAIEDERKSRYYLTHGESADPSEVYVDSFENSGSETYHFYHCLVPTNDQSSSSEVIPDYSEVEQREIRVCATPDREASTPSNQQVSSGSTPQEEEAYDRTNGWRKERQTTPTDGDRPHGGIGMEQLYATLEGEELYSVVDDRVPTTADTGPFFEETERFWCPAADYASLYQQLANKKYRELQRNQIELTKFIGSGQFGTVMKGVWLLPGSSKDVAIKTLKEGSSEEDKVKFLQEAAINGQFWHPNVVRLMGVVTVGEPVMIVLELLPNGDLRDYLCKTVSNNITSDTPHTLLRFCKEISSGMKYLARKNFIHRDLAARNILVAEDTTCKISDFGMSRDLEDEHYYVSHGGKVPVKWTAPEAIHYKKYSTASDVWSFGCVMYEIWTVGKKPFEGNTNPQVVRMVDQGYRPPPPPACPLELYRLMIECWHPDKSQRRTFDQLQEILTDFPLTVTEIHLLGTPLDTTAPDVSSSALQNTYASEVLYDYQ